MTTDNKVTFHDDCCCGESDRSWQICKHHGVGTDYDNARLAEEKSSSKSSSKVTVEVIRDQDIGDNCAEVTVNGLSYRVYGFDDGNVDNEQAIYHVIERIAELEAREKAAKHWRLTRDAMVMAKSRALLGPGYAPKNMTLYATVFGISRIDAIEPCRKLGLNPDSADTCYTKMCAHIQTNGIDL